MNAEAVGSNLPLWQDGSLQLTAIILAALLLKFLGQCRPSKVCFWLISFPIAGLWLSILWPPITAFFGVYNLSLCLLLLVDRFLLTPAPDKLSLKRTYPAKVSIQETTPVQLTVENHSDQPLTIRIFDQTPSSFKRENAQAQTIRLAPDSQQIVTYHCKPTLRGPFHLGPLSLSYRSRLNLLWLNKQDKTPQPIFVSPDLRLIKKMRIRFSKALTGGELQKRRRGANGTEFDGLRNYATGDDIRKMDWQATARLDSPIVRTFTHQVEQPILVLLDAGRKMQAQTGDVLLFDWALNSALAMAGVALDRGDQVAMSAFDQSLLWPIRFGMGSRQLKILLDEFAAMQPSGLEPDYEGVMLQAARQLKKRTLVIVFTDLIDPLASRSLTRGLQAFSKNHLLVIVTPQPLTLKQQALLIPDSVQDAYEKAVMLDLLQVREKALLTLSKSNRATVIDTPPEQMSESLVNHYLTVKLRNQL